MGDDSNVTWRSVLSRPLEQDVFQPLSAVVTVEAAAASICGAAHAENTDHYLAIELTRQQRTLLSSLPESDLPAPFTEHGYALIVADGLGQSGAGARASRVALSTLAHLAVRYGRWNLRINAANAGELIDLGEFYYRRTHDALLEAKRDDPSLSEMAASVTAVYIAGGDLFFAHVGHARAFLYRDGRLLQLTVDHTLERERAESEGRVQTGRQGQDATHELTDVVGGANDPRVDIEHFELVTGDRLLLCTNGLTDAIGHNEIAGVLALKRRAADDCQRFVDLARTAHATDDVTVMVADYMVRR
jgi:PPM family protein phosphatase